MKKAIILSAMLLSAVAGHSQTAIDFSISGMPEGLSVMLFRSNGQGGERVYSQKIENDGNFQYTFCCDSLMGDRTYFQLMVMDTAKMIQYGNNSVYLYKGSKIGVEGSGPNPGRWKINSSHPGQAFNNAITGVQQDFLDQDREIIQKMRQPGANVDSLGEISSEIYSKLEAAIVEKMAQMPVDEYWLGYFKGLCAYFEENPESEICAKLMKLYDSLSDSDKQSKQGRVIYQKIFGKDVEEGDKMPDCDLCDRDGKTSRLSDFMGKYLIVDFTTYFCGPCRIAVPFISYLHDASGGSVEFVSVSNDPREDFMKIGVHGTYPSFYDPEGDGGIFAACRIVATPTFYVVAPDGTVARKFLGLSTEMLNIVRGLDGFKWSAKAERLGKQKIVALPRTDTISNFMVIEKVALGPDSTVIDFASFMPQYSISAGSVLKCGGRDYKVRSASIAFDTPLTNEIGSAARFSAVFEPLPADAQKFDFYDCFAQGCSRIMGVEIPK